MKDLSNDAQGLFLGNSTFYFALNLRDKASNLLADPSILNVTMEYVSMDLSRGKAEVVTTETPIPFRT